MKAKLSTFTLAVALDYGSRDELARRAAELVAEARSGRGPRRVDERAIAQRLYADDMPDVDLFIRTSNELRISNFLLWQIAYAEFFVTETLWPDFSPEEFLQALHSFATRSRRRGGV
jgi:undecaprenyl diphosphate synthase